MTAAEMTDWAAYERVYGPILLQERLDIGLAQIGLILAKLLGKKSKHTIRDFLPSWWQEHVSKTGRDEASIRQGFEALMRMAENADA